MDKNQLRLKYKALRQDLSFEQIEDFSLAISNQLLKLNIWNHMFYHVFLSIEEQKELNTDYILNILGGKDKNIVISKSNFEDFSMVHFLLTDNTRIKKNSFNIPEPQDGIEIKPEQIDVVFVPLLAFDKVGNRVGYGKGFYDRFLSQCRQDVLKIGLSFYQAETNQIDVSKNDIKLDYCITPKLIYKY